ncbi:MAG: transposase [Anaerolineae bacterium]|nr:transposase [Anaerolineae bacterium]
MKKETVRRYSLAFKQQVVREYEAGASIYSLRDKYGIGSHLTVQRWIERYGRFGYRAELVVIQTAEDQEGLKALKRRVAELESALAQSTLDNRMLEATLTVASEALRLDLKKNFGKKS